MKTHFSLILLTLLLLTGCGPGDSERLIGTWKPHTVTVDGEILVSLDSHIQWQAIEREWKRSQKEGVGTPRQAIEDELDMQAGVLRGMSMRFEPKGKATLTTVLGGNNASLNGSWTIDENKHRLTVSYAKMHPVVYRYEFRDDELYLEHANSETIFRQAKK